MANLVPLLIICHVPYLVSAVLRPPTNLSLISENFRHILTWDDPNNKSPIYYNVTCHSNSAIKCKSCFNITSRRCDLTKDLTDLLSEYTMVVRSFTDHEVSDIATTKAFNPISHTRLGPVLVEVVPCDHCIEVSIKPPVSHIWSEEEQSNISMLRDEIYPLLVYSIHYGTSKDQHQLKDNVDNLDNVTVIKELLPNTEYCVWVDVNSSINDAPSIPSALQCVTTGPEPSSVRLDVILPVLIGLFLFFGLLFLLCALDKAGYISMPRKYYPKVLKSMVRSESRYSGSSGCTSPTCVVPVEIISQKLGVKESLENEDKLEEGGYASRKRLLDSDTSGGDSSGPVLSTNSSSLESSGQTTESSGDERIPAEHPAALDIITDLSRNFPPLPGNPRASTPDLLFNNNGVFNINLNSICIGNSAHTRTDLANGGTLKEEPEGEADMNSGQAELSLGGDVRTSNVSAHSEPTEMDYGGDEEELSDNADDCGSDNRIVSGYMSR